MSSPPQGSAPQHPDPLSPERWRQLESLLDALLDTPPERRAALFAEVSGGDPARRAELERLVAECERAFPLLDRPASDRFGALVDTPALEPSQVVAERYRITGEIGRGGMATVYLARDLKHGRDVAVKVVRSELSAALGGGRFLREIEIAARLRHPNIVPLYDSGRLSAGDPATGGDGSREGALYYVMPFEPGPSLRERIRDGPLPIGDVVAVLRDVCDALAHAHERGVVHRDIKPDNVLLSGRHALVTDFGVARAATEAAESAVTTGAGVMIGTPSYMAPEQIAADPRVDHRADIYAVGVLAYEMLAGRPPFAGDSPPEILAAHLARTPDPIATHRPDVPPALAELVMRCLEKRPDDRWQRAAELVARLRSIEGADGAPMRAVPSRRRPIAGLGRAAAVLATVAAAVALLWMLRRPAPAAPPSPPALAVLVFQHGNHADLEPLAMGLTTGLIGALGEVPRLNVRSLRAVWPYRDPGLRLDSVGRALDVPWLVGGRVDRIGSENVVSVELTDATGRLLAHRRAVGPPGDDPALIEDLVAQVAVMLRERIGDHVRLEGWRVGTRSAAAFAAVNQAYRDVRDADALMQNDVPGARERLRRADSTLERASRADPVWTEPHVQRAWIARKLASALGPGGVDPDAFAAGLRRGVAHAEAALRIRPGAPRALEVRGVLLYEASLVAPADSARRLHSAAQRALVQATDADSTLARALNVLSAIHYARGELEQARLMAVRAHAADAYSEDAMQVLGRLFHIDFDDARDTDARRWCTAYARQSPRDWFPGYCRLMLMGWDSTEAPDPDEAWRLARSATAAAPDDFRSAIAAQLRILVAGVLARLGPAGGAQRVLDEVHAATAADPTATVEPFGSELLTLEAGVRVRLGQPREAVELLRAYLRRASASPEMVARGRRFRALPIEQLRDTVGGGR